MRTPKPWYWVARDCWCVTIDGKRVVLARGKAAKTEATTAFHRLMAKTKNERRFTSTLRVGEVCNLYVAHAQKHLAPLTAEFYARHLESFAKHAGRVAVEEAAPKHVTGWLDKHPGWGQSTRSQAITAVKRAFRWAKREGRVPVNPFADLDKPGMRTRSVILTDDQARAIRAEIKHGDPFGDFLDFMAETGARPSEAMAVEASHLSPSEGLIALASKTTAKTGRLRVIHLSPMILARLVELARKYPTGPLLRTTEGTPWNRNATATRFARLREKLGYGPEATAESYRHKFATDLLESDVPIATVAALMGHTSTAMVGKVYSKLRDRHQHLKDALAKRKGSDQVPSPHESGPTITNGSETGRRLGDDGSSSGEASAVETSHDR